MAAPLIPLTAQDPITGHQRITDHSLLLFGQYFASENPLAAPQAAQLFSSSVLDQQSSGGDSDGPLFSFWNQVLAIDLGGVFFGMKYEIPAILASGGGAIVNMSSGAGVVGQPGTPAYVAAKHAIVGLTKATALEYARRNLRVTAVAPGFVETESMRALPDEVRAELADMHPVGRIGRPEEIAELTSFLLSDRAAFITGSVHLIDGGITAR